MRSNRGGRTVEIWPSVTHVLDEVACWLRGYRKHGLSAEIEKEGEKSQIRSSEEKRAVRRRKGRRTSSPSLEHIHAVNVEQVLVVRQVEERSRRSCTISEQTRSAFVSSSGWVERRRGRRREDGTHRSLSRQTS